MRIDKFIWCVRLTKTRSLASKWCTTHKVQVNQEFVKPSKTIKINDVVLLKEHPTWRSFKVIDFPKNRVGAKLINEYIIETTPEVELELIKEFQLNQRFNKTMGLKGRPTKKDRRDISKFTE